MALGPRNAAFGGQRPPDEEEVRARLWHQRQQQQTNTRQAPPTGHAPHMSQAPTTSQAPRAGEDHRFDAKVAALARRKETIREECWSAFGGQGAPAEVGAIPDFDASVDAAFAAVRRADQQREAADRAAFERAVQSEMASQMADVKAEARHEIQRESKMSPQRYEAKAQRRESVADLFGAAEPRFPVNRRHEAKDDHVADAKLAAASSSRFARSTQGASSIVFG